MDKRDEEVGVSAVALESLERNFVDVMKELNAEENLERFKTEYEKLHRALRKSHDGEKRLVKKCQELNQEIVSNASKLQSALQLSQDDESTISSLRKEIEKAWKMVDGAHEKENKAKDSIQNLKKEVSRLTSFVEQGSGLALGHESNLQDLLEEKRSLGRDRDALKLKVEEKLRELKESNDRIKKAQGNVEVVEIELTSRQAQSQQLLMELENQRKQRDVSERKVQQFHLAIEQRSKQAELARDTLTVRTEEQESLERQAKDETERFTSLSKRCNDLQQELAAETQALAQLDHQNILLKAEVPRRQHEFDKKDEELKLVTSKIATLEAALERQTTDIATLQKTKDIELSKLPGIQEDIKKRTLEIDELRRKIELKERSVKEKQREENLTITKSAKEESERVKLEGKRTIEEGKNRSLAQELESLLRANQLMRNQIGQLELQQRAYADDAQEAISKFGHVVEQGKLGAERATLLQLELEDTGKKLKTQLTLYEQVRSDRALYKKSLNDAQGEIENMHKKFKLMDRHIDHLKEELSVKEKLLCQSHASHKQLGKDITNAEQRVTHLREDHQHAKGRGDALEDEVKQLAQIISDCDTEKAKQLMKYNAVVNERNILATQLIKRNDELAVLYEKIRVQQSSLSKGETQYRERLVDVRMLRDKVHEMRLSLRVALARIQSIDEMKRQVTSLQRAVVQERARVKALYEELQNPMNVHRWRRVEGSAPQEMDNILKVQTLLKRLGSKADECRAKSELIKQKEGRYGQLKNILSRQPGPEIVEQLNIYHENVVKRAEQLAQMEAQLISTQAQVTEHHQETDKNNRELVETKRRFFATKSKNTTLRREHTLAVQQSRGTVPNSGGGGATLNSGLPVRFQADQPKFAGGGFSLGQ